MIEKANWRAARASWWRWNWRFLRQLFEGAVSHVARRAGSLDTARTKAFFEDRYRNGDPTVFDGGTEGYHDALWDLLERWGTEVIVDLGCGEGTLLRFLQDDPSSDRKYLGLDFAEGAAPSGLSGKVFRGDIRDVPPSPIAGARNRTVVCVNTLCYIDQIHTVALLGRHAAGGDVCLILEPYPCWFWDRTFSKISPKYRTPEEVLSELLSLGWDVCDIQCHYVFLSRFLRVFPVSYSLVARKT
jgi:SAM-dependent methyltransferase